MEFPHLGKTCSEQSCQRLDFLPVKCDACDCVFCHEHMRYTSHNCPSAYKKDVQVPVCPLCSQPVPVGRNQQADEVVGAHMDNDCQSEPAQSRRKVFANKCTVKGCRQKEVVPVVCPDCKLNFCLRHRHAQDHKCEGAQAAVRNQAAKAAMARQQNVSSKSTNRVMATTSSTMASAAAAAGRIFNRTPRETRVPSVSAIQGSMSEDEALARALQESMRSGPGVSSAPSSVPSPAMSQEEEDRQLALAIAESERQQRNQLRPRQATTTGSSQEKSCQIS